MNALSANNNQESQSDTESVNQNDKDETESLYPSAETLLTFIQKEYDIEASRKRDIEARTGILIALLGVLIGFYSSIMDFKIFKTGDAPLEYIGLIFLGLIYIFPLVTLFLSMRHFIKVLNAKTYRRMGLGNNYKEMAQNSKEDTSIRLAESYKIVVEDNDKSNENKAIQFKKGINLLYLSLIAVIITYIIKQIISLII